MLPLPTGVSTAGEAEARDAGELPLASGETGYPLPPIAYSRPLGLVASYIVKSPHSVDRIHFPAFLLVLNSI
jgi:hypothetical protein